MRLPSFIAKRYLFSKSGTNAVNIITLVSVISIVIGTIVFLVVLSAFAGLKEFNLSVISAIDPDLKVLPATGKIIKLSPKQETQLSKIEGIAAFSKIIEERAYLEYEGKTHLGFLKGVDQNFLKVNRMDTTVFAGTWHSQNEPEVVIGAGVRRRLSVALGDYGSLLSIMVPKPGKGQITDPSQAFRKSSAIASGIFQVGESIDNDYVFTHIDYVGKLLNYELDEVSTLEIKLHPEYDQETTKTAIKEILGKNTLVKNRIELNDTTYRMLNTENLAAYFVSTLVVIIVLFSFIGSIIMIIIDKRSHIKTLSDLGTSIKDLRKTFFLQGVYMVVIGSTVGIILGILIIKLQELTGAIKITASMAYPTHLTISNIIIVFITILLLGTAAAKLASSRVTRKLIAA